MKPPQPWRTSAARAVGPRWSKRRRLALPLRAALARRPHDCDLLVVSLGYDTLDGDPCAADGHRMAIQCEDFSRMRALLHSAQVPILVVQEGGYHMEKIAAAALAFCRGSPCP